MEVIEFFNAAREKKLAAMAEIEDPSNVTNTIINDPSISIKNGYLLISGGEGFSFKIINTEGKIVFQGLYNAQEQGYDLTSLADGLYILTTDTGFAHKFIR